MSNLPWLPDFVPPGLDPNLASVIGGLIQTAEQTATAVIPAVLPDIIPAVIPAPPTTTVNPASPPNTPSASANTVQSWLQQEAIKAVQEVLAKGLAKDNPDQLALPTLEDFTKADARSRALRTLFVGLGLSALWGLVNSLSQLGGMTWDKNALPQVITLAVGSVLTAVTNYVGRIIKEPAHVAPLTQGLPTKT